ncbi:MAG: pyridoxal-phosphate dependent enzyme [Thermonemataceae bacterium]|nr:pyridoxal-phosphate dependent enzyme [Thermonemataceae bacterium]
MFENPNLANFVEQISSDFFGDNSLQLTLFVLRLDKLHPYISGNKWFKLKYNLLEAQKKKFQKILTFGGAHSNHILATAVAGQLFDLQTIGVIRGEELQQKLNPVLKQAQDFGMQFYFVSREQYREQHKYSANFIEKLKEVFGEFYLIPEGGSNSLALQGTSEILTFLKSYPIHFEHISSCVGTGGTLAGLAKSLYNSTTKLHGFAVLKNAGFLVEDIKKLLDVANFSPYQDFTLHLDYHFGGYAKSDANLSNFIAEFHKKYNFCIEPVYTAKMFWGIADLAKKGFFKEKDKILAIHTGGTSMMQEVG